MYKKVPSQIFSFKENVFVAFASDLYQYDVKGYENIELVSAKTGKIALFIFDQNEKDQDGDVTCSIMKCIAPGLTHLKMIIFND